MKYLVILLALAILVCSSASAQSSLLPDTSKARQDSIKHARKLADSLKWAKLLSIAQYPLIKGGKWSGVIPVDNPTEIPDPNRDYKLLFEFVEKNPDSLAKDINNGLEEVVRLLNLHVASGIPAKKLFPVIVIHGKGIEAVTTNEWYKKKHSIENPNLKVVQDLKDIGAKFIVCGQAMAFLEFKKEDLLPDIKISLTAQTVLSNYQLQGYVLYSIREDK
jgi:intracellular sulfur oxidation DsrE/DsrF family protein